MDFGDFQPGLRSRNWYLNVEVENGIGQEGCGNEESLCLCNRENDAKGFRKALMEYR